MFNDIPPPSHFGQDSFQRSLIELCRTSEELPSSFPPPKWPNISCLLEPPSERTLAKFGTWLRRRGGGGGGDAQYRFYGWAGSRALTWQQISKKMLPAFPLASWGEKSVPKKSAGGREAFFLL